jgi:Bacterial Ig-like domain
VRLRRDVPFEVVHVEPPDGAQGVLRDDPIVVQLSGPVDAERLPEAVVEVLAAEEGVRLRIEPMDGGRALVVRPLHPLRPVCRARLRVEGLKDARGREAPPLETAFTTGALVGRELCEY